MVLYLAYASFALLSAICVLCVGTWIAVAGVFVLSGSVMDYPMTSIPRLLARDLRRVVTTPVALVVALAFAGGSVTALALFPREAGSGPPAVETHAAGEPEAATQQGDGSPDAAFRQWFEQQPRQDPGVPADGAAVVIVKFTDYQCPACAQAHREYKSVLAKYQASHPGAVRYVVKNFPLDPECNFNTPGGTHRASCEAAAAVHMAEARNRGVQMQDWLYNNQQMLTPQSVRQAAGAIGGVPDFDAQYPKALQAIRSEIASAGALNIRATPTFFINGRTISGALPPQYFDQAIAIELGRAAAAK
jgi:protein-disulfide isomerase